MSTSYTLTNIRERGVYYGGDRYRVFYTVSQAASMIGMVRSNLLARVQRNTVEYILLTDWNRQDTEHRAMIEERVILYEKEKFVARREKRKPEKCHYKQIVITINKNKPCIYLPASNYSLIGDIVNEYEDHEFNIKYEVEEIDPQNEKPLKDISEIYLKDEDIVQAIPYIIIRRNSKQKKLFDGKNKFDIYLIAQIDGKTVTDTLDLDSWNELREQILEDKKFDILRENLSFQ